MKKEEIEVLQLQAKECQRASKPLEARKKAWKASPLQVLERAWSYWDLDFGFLASQLLRQLISVVLSHMVCGTLLQQP